MRFLKYDNVAEDIKEDVQDSIVRRLDSVSYFICDIDGTLSDATHRLHHVRGERKKRNWPAFQRECVNDPVIEPVKRVVNSLWLSGYYVMLFSGRNAGKEGKYLDKTVEWLEDNGVRFHGIYMRNDGNYENDADLKSAMLDEVVNEFGYYPVFAIDDRKRVKRMWVDRNVFVFDVNQKDVEF